MFSTCFSALEWTKKRRCFIVRAEGSETGLKADEYTHCHNILRLMSKPREKKKKVIAVTVRPLFLLFINISAISVCSSKLGREGKKYVCLNMH